MLPQKSASALLVFVLSALASPHASAEDWLRWGGPNGDFTVETSGLAETWPTDGPRHLTPIVKCDDAHIWVASQFPTGGGRLLEITKRETAMDARQVWFDRKLRASHWTSVRIGDHIYGSIGGNDLSFLAAFEWKTGKIAWPRRGFHKAQCLYAGGKLLFLDESGQLALAKVIPEKLEVLAKAKVTESVSWTLPTLVGTKLYLRDRKHILALDLGRDAR